MYIELELLSTSKKGSKIVAKIRANNSDEALAYFKGRFSYKGILTRTNTKNIFTIKQSN